LADDSGPESYKMAKKNVAMRMEEGTAGS